MRVVMARRAAHLGALVIVIGLAAASVSDTAARTTAALATTARVARVIDGDTIVLADGTHVRLVQIDTPEVGTGECFSRAAGRELRALLPPGAVVALETDPRLDQVDRYGRLLRYVVRNGRNLNVELVRRGAATVWFYDGDRGRYAVRLLAAATAARSAHRGLWGACPKAVWNPYAAASTGPGSPAAASTAARRPVAGGSCDPSYPTVCIPPPPPDLDCGDVPSTGFPVQSPDPHRFDGDHDGRGCEG
jgi:micrococcal nuclease